MRFYASRYMSPWKSTRDIVVPPGTVLTDNLQNALLWFIDNPYRRLKPRVPVILLVELEQAPDAFDPRVRGHVKNDSGISFRFRQRASWLEGHGRILPTEEDFLCVMTERRILSGDTRKKVPVVVPLALIKVHSTSPLLVGAAVQLTTSGDAEHSATGDFVVVDRHGDEYTLRSAT